MLQFKRVAVLKTAIRTKIKQTFKSQSKVSDESVFWPRHTVKNKLFNKVRL